MSIGTDWALSKNQQVDNANELDVAGEARLFKALRHFWHPVLYAHELGDAPEKVVLCEQQLVVVRLNGEPRAFNDLCAHRGSALSLGKVVKGQDGDELRCPYHGWQYNDGGRCTFAPQRPDLAGHLRARVRSYPCQESDGMIWVCLEEEPRFPIPRCPEFSDPTFRFLHTPSTNWKCSAPRRTENYTDLAHFAIVHDGTLGDVNEPEVPKHDVWRSEDWEDSGILRMYLEKEISNREAGFNGDPVVGKRSYHICMPLNVHLRMDMNDNVYVLWFHPTPISGNEIRNFTWAGRNHDLDDEAKLYEDMVRLNEIVYDEDQPVVESQRPELLPEDLAVEMHLQQVDTFSMTYRKWLVELARELVPEA